MSAVLIREKKRSSLCVHVTVSSWTEHEANFCHVSPTNLTVGCLLQSMFVHQTANVQTTRTKTQE